MNKYSLEVEIWGEWELEKDFSNIETAKNYGFSRLSQNNWRILYRPTGEILYVYNQETQLEEVARQELDRFQTRDTWRERFATARQNPVIGEVASNQRRRRRVYTTRDFNFVGLAPDHLYMEGFFERPKKSSVSKINWKKEGF